MVSDLQRIISLHDDPSMSVPEKVAIMSKGYNLYFTTEQDLTYFFSAPIVPIAKQIVVMSTDSNGDFYTNDHIFSCNTDDADYIRKFSSIFYKLFLDFGYDAKYDEIHLLEKPQHNWTPAIKKMYERLGTPYENVVYAPYKGIKFYSYWIDKSTYSNFGTGTDALEYHYVLVA